MSWYFEQNKFAIAVSQSVGSFPLKFPVLQWRAFKNFVNTKTNPGISHENLVFNIGCTCFDGLLIILTICPDSDAINEISTKL